MSWCFQNPAEYDIGDFVLGMLPQEHIEHGIPGVSPDLAAARDLQRCIARQHFE